MYGLCPYLLLVHPSVGNYIYSSLLQSLVFIFICAQVLNEYDIVGFSNKILIVIRCQDLVKYDSNNRSVSYCIGASYSPAGLHGYTWLTRVRC